MRAAAVSKGNPLRPKMPLSTRRGDGPNCRDNGHTRTNESSTGEEGATCGGEGCGTTERRTCTSDQLEKSSKEQKRGVLRTNWRPCWRASETLSEMGFDSAVCCCLPGACTSCSDSARLCCTAAFWPRPRLALRFHIDSQLSPTQWCDHKWIPTLDGSAISGLNFGLVGPRPPQLQESAWHDGDTGQASLSRTGSASDGNNSRFQFSKGIASMPQAIVRVKAAVRTTLMIKTTACSSGCMSSERSDKNHPSTPMTDNKRNPSRCRVTLQLSTFQWSTLQSSTLQLAILKRETASRQLSLKGSTWTTRLHRCLSLWYEMTPNFFDYVETVKFNKLHSSSLPAWHGENT